jgi:hypothetical protein
VGCPDQNRSATWRHRADLLLLFGRALGFFAVGLGAFSEAGLALTPRPNRQGLIGKGIGARCLLAGAGVVTQVIRGMVTPPDRNGSAGVGWRRGGEGKGVGP